MSTPHKIHEKAVATARHYFRNRRYTLEKAAVTTEEKSHTFLARRDAVALKVAVKASTRMWEIPELAPHEITPER